MLLVKAILMVATIVVEMFIMAIVIPGDGCGDAGGGGGRIGGGGDDNHGENNGEGDKDGGGDESDDVR